MTDSTERAEFEKAHKAAPQAPAPTIPVWRFTALCERCGEPPEAHRGTHWCDNQSFAAAPQAQPAPAELWEQVTLTQADVNEARELILKATATKFLSSGRGDAPAIRGWLLRANMMLIGDLARSPEPARGTSADGSLSVDEAVNGVLALYPGANRQALQRLAELMAKPPEPAPVSDERIDRLWKNAGHWRRMDKHQGSSARLRPRTAGREGHAMNPDDIIPYTSDDSAAAARLLVDLAKPADAIAAMRLALDALTGWMDQPDTAAAYDAAMQRATQAVAALRAALPPERRPFNPMCAWPFPEKKL